MFFTLPDLSWDLYERKTIQLARTKNCYACFARGFYVVYVRYLSDRYSWFVLQKVQIVRGSQCRTLFFVFVFYTKPATSLHLAGWTILTEILEKSTPKPKNYHWKPTVGTGEKHRLPRWLRGEKWLNSFAYRDDDDFATKNATSTGIVSLNNNSITINYLYFCFISRRSLLGERSANFVPPHLITTLLKGRGKGRERGVLTYRFSRSLSYYIHTV